MKSGGQSQQENKEQKASEREQQQLQEKLQMKQANIKKKQEKNLKQAPPQQLFQGGYGTQRPQQNSQSPVRYDKISAANTKQGFARKDPAEKGHQEHGGRNNPKRPAYDRFEDSGFLVPNNHGHSSVFQEVQGTDAQGTHHRGGGGGIFENLFGTFTFGSGGGGGGGGGQQRRPQQRQQQRQQQVAVKTHTYVVGLSIYRRSIAGRAKIRRGIARPDFADPLLRERRPK
jgi:hypothetical protein